MGANQTNIRVIRFSPRSPTANSRRGSADAGKLETTRESDAIAVFVDAYFEHGKPDSSPGRLGASAQKCRVPGLWCWRQGASAQARGHKQYKAPGAPSPSDPPLRAAGGAGGAAAARRRWRCGWRWRRGWRGWRQRLRWRRLRRRGRRRRGLSRKTSVMYPYRAPSSGDCIKAGSDT